MRINVTVKVHVIRRLFPRKKFGIKREALRSGLTLFGGNCRNMLWFQAKLKAF